MLRFVGVALLSALTLAADAQVRGEAYALARVGDEVDPGERAYFLLFPSLSDGDTLRLSWAGPDSVRVASSGAALVLSREQARALDAALADYEALFLSPDPALETAAVSGLVRWRRPYESRLEAIVTRRDGSEVRGTLLDADADGVLMATGRPLLSGVRRTDHLVWVPAQDVVRVRQFGFRSGLDVRPGGGRSRYVAEALPALRREVAFPRGLPPELRSWRRSQPAPPEASGLRPDNRFSRVPLNRWQVGFRLRTARLGAGITTTDPFGVPPPITEEWRAWTVGGRGRVGYNLTPRLGLEVSAVYQTSEQMSGLVIDARRYATVMADVTASYALLRPQLRRPSLVVRAGPSLLWLRSTTDLEYLSERETLSGIARFEESAVHVGVASGVDLGARLSRGVSLVGGFEGALYPKVKEPEMVLRDDRIGVALKRVEARAVGFSFRGVEVGAVFHLGEW